MGVWQDIGALFTPTEKTKLAGVDTGATDDQTGAEIKTAYEGEADTNVFDDAGVTKLAGVEAAATKYPDTGEQAFLDADHTKLDGVEAGADVTGSNAPQSHGASVHTDRNRKIFLSAPMYYTSGGDMTENGLRMVADASTEAVYYLKVPEDFSSVIQLRAVYRTFYNGNAQNAYVILKAYYGGLGERFDVHQENSLYYAIDMTGKTFGFLYETHHASVGLTSLAKNDFIKVYFKRYGESANDTWVYDIMLIGIELEYIADM